MLLPLIALAAVIVWLFIFHFVKPYRKQFFWMGFLAAALISAALLVNTDWMLGAQLDAYFWLWLAALLILVFFVGSLGAIAYEWSFSVKWKRPFHQHHHQVGILVIGPLLALIGFLVVPAAALQILLAGIAVEVVLLLFLRSDLIVDGLFSGLFIGLLLTLLFLFFFGTAPGVFLNGLTLSGITWYGLPVELVIFFFFLGVLWGPWYEVMKDYHTRK